MIIQDKDKDWIGLDWIGLDWIGYIRYVNKIKINK